MKFSKMQQIKQRLKNICRNSIRMYFAPLTGAIKGVRLELKRQERRFAKY